MRSWVPIFNIILGGIGIGIIYLLFDLREIWLSQPPAPSSFSAPSPTSYPQAPLLSEQHPLSHFGQGLFEQYQSALVRVRGTITQVDEEGNPKAVLQVGTGFFISKEGEVLTTATVAENKERVWVEYQNAIFPAQCVAIDTATNVALLKVIVPPKQFTVIPISPQTPQPPVGSMLFSLSLPFECNPSFKQGWAESYDDAYGQRMFPVYHLRSNVGGNPGEGGAPIFDDQNRLVGMAVYMASILGSSYILPISTLGHVLEDLKATSAPKLRLSKKLDCPPKSW
jgi:S1-C subfamily serine protease